MAITLKPILLVVHADDEEDRQEAHAGAHLKSSAVGRCQRWIAAILIDVPVPVALYQ